MDDFEIMLNKSCVGSWGESSDDHIPHEIINSFRADNGRIYLYVPPSGGFSTQTHSKIKYIVVTGAWHKGKTEILYVAKDLVPMHKGGKKASESEREKQRQYIRQENIAYCGKYLDQIEMSDNSEESIFYISFEVGSILFPQKRMFLSWNASDFDKSADSVIVLHDKDYRYQRQTGYLTGADCEKVASIIETSDYWNASHIIETVKDNSEYSLLKTRPSLIHLIGKEYDENAMTNLLFAFLQDNLTVLQLFAQKILGISGENIFSLKREYSVEHGRIDLLAISDKNVIIIENKIKSGLHGIDKHNQLSQLSKYYQYIEKKFSGKKISAFLLSPNYNIIDITDFDPAAAKKYTPIKYSALLKFFSEHRHNYDNTPLEKYYDDFLETLRIHSLTMQETVRMRFLRAIMKGTE